MVEIANIIFLLVIFFFLYRKDKADKKREEDILNLFNNTVKNVLDQVESNTEKFYEMTAKMQVKHFENLEKHTGKLLKLLEQKPTQIKDEIKKLDPEEENEIAREEIHEDPFSEDNHIPIVQGLNVQFEGEETISPINIE